MVYKAVVSRMNRSSEARSYDRDCTLNSIKPVCTNRSVRPCAFLVIGTLRQTQLTPHAPGPTPYAGLPPRVVRDRRARDKRHTIGSSSAIEVRLLQALDYLPVPPNVVLLAHSVMVQKQLLRGLRSRSDDGHGAITVNIVPYIIRFIAVIIINNYSDGDSGRISNRDSSLQIIILF